VTDDDPPPSGARPGDPPPFFRPDPPVGPGLPVVPPKVTPEPPRPEPPMSEAALDALAARLAGGGVVTLEPHETRLVVVVLRRLAESEARNETAESVISACRADAAAFGGILKGVLGRVGQTLATPSPVTSFDTEASIRARARLIAAARRDAAGAGLLGAVLRFAASFL